MRKQEKIIEAYGEYYESAKDRIDENGFYVNVHKNCQIVLKEGLSVDFMVYKDKIRPRCLEGIETNNGWTPIKDKRPEIGDKIISYRELSERIVEDIEIVTREFLIWYDMNNITHWKYYESKTPIY